MRTLGLRLRWFILIMLIAGALAACAEPEAADAPPGSPTTAPTHPVATRASVDTTRPTDTPAPTLTEAAQTVPTPLPEDQRDYELCVSLASDSNGYGHVTFQRPDTGEVAITYITPIAVPLQAHLDALGLSYLQVVDRSLSAGGLTIASSNYLESDQYFHLKADRCKFVVVTPFYPDVAVNLSRPQDYINNMNWLLQGLTAASPASRVLVLNFYQTDRAEFTADNSGRGLYPERIDAFNQALEEACAPGGVIAAYEQVTCVDIRPFFGDMPSPVVLAETTLEDYRAALYRETGFTPILDDYFAKNPDGVIIGDGIHLSLAGRDRLAERLAGIIFDMTDDF
ncbi:MAG: hypothetical protein WBH90_14430 [Aggregatilineales bacterium]|nr:hypothetical protein [Aggregatilineales bacterium]HQE19631.1 hypothetical protein [Aggregatilineales bacterium]